MTILHFGTELEDNMFYIYDEINKEWVPMTDHQVKAFALELLYPQPWSAITGIYPTLWNSVRIKFITLN